MNVAIIGASGCVGTHLVEALKSEPNIYIRASYRTKKEENANSNCDSQSLNLEHSDSVEGFIKGVDVVVYLVHSLDSKDFYSKDLEYAQRVGEICKKAEVKKIVYLGGLIQDETQASKHLQSRLETGNKLRDGGVPVLEARASIVLANCSSSFKLVDNIVKHFRYLPAPTRMSALCSPIYIDDLIAYLKGLILTEPAKNQIYELEGETMPYKDFLAAVARIRYQKPFRVIYIPLLPKTLAALMAAKISKVNPNLVNNLFESIEYNSCPSNKYELMSKNTKGYMEQSLKNLS